MKISTGIIKEPHFILIFGSDGIGKTTFASEAPKPIIVGPEAGSKRINTTRAEGIKTYDDIIGAIRWLREEKHDFQSIGLDSLDWIEPVLWKKICDEEGVDSIEKVGGGYGKGYTAALAMWDDLIYRLKDVRDNRQMNVIAIAHSQVKTVNDPMVLTPYDRHMLKLNDKASAKWREAVDAVLFASFEDVVFKEKSTDKKAKATGDGVRKLYTTRRAAFDAKNRYGLPSELPLSWSAFAEAAALGEPDSLSTVKNDLVELILEMRAKDTNMAARMDKAITDAKDDIQTLIKIRNHARTLVN